MSVVINGSPVSGSVTISEDLKTIGYAVTGGMQTGDNVSVTVNNTLKDKAGNQLAAPVSVQFDYAGEDIGRGGEAPEVLNIVYKKTNEFNVVFSKRIAAGTVESNIQLRKEDGSSSVVIAGTVSLNPDRKTATVTPDETLIMGEEYSILVSTLLTDDSGLAINEFLHRFVVLNEDMFIYEKGNENLHTKSRIGNNHLFHGRTYEPENGLYYYRHRYYLPRIGRFLQTDPMGYKDSMNPYQAFGMNPANFTDPMGLDYGNGLAQALAEEQLEKQYKEEYGEEEGGRRYWAGWWADRRIEAKFSKYYLMGVGTAVAFKFMSAYAVIATIGSTMGYTAIDSYSDRKMAGHTETEARRGAFGDATGINLVFHAIGYDYGTLDEVTSEQKTEAIAAIVGGGLGFMFGNKISPALAEVPIGNFIESTPVANSAQAEYNARINSEGLTIRAQGRITGPHHGRKKGYVPEPVGGRAVGHHRGHLVAEGLVDNPKLVNVKSNIISEARRSNLGPKRKFEYKAGQLAKKHPNSFVETIHFPKYKPSNTVPYAVTHYVRIDGKVVYGVSIMNK